MELLEEFLDRIRIKRPLVYNITNIVTVNDCANALLAVGASPVMGLEASETKDLISISDSLVLNIGTATTEIGTMMIEAARHARNKGIPVILDPVGAGASQFRTNLSIRIIEEVHPIIRCNYSEFLTLAGIRSETRGVDSLQNDFFDLNTIKKLAEYLKCILVVTGKNDIITDGNKTITTSNGTPRMEEISGTGCICSSLVGAAATVSENKCQLIYSIASLIALMGICGEKASENFRGTASMKLDIIDSLSTLTKEEFRQRLILQEF